MKILPRWIPPGQISPNLNLTQTLTLTQMGIHPGGGIAQGEIFRIPINIFLCTPFFL